VSDIPVLFPEFGFKISNFNTLDSTVDAITPEFLDKLSTHFFLNHKWLKTGDRPIQEIFKLGYDFEAIYEFIVNFQPTEDMFVIAYFVAEKGIKFVPAYDHGSNETVAIIIEIIHGDDGGAGLKYSRFLPLYSGYWHYYKTRMMIKSISLLLFQDQKLIPQKGLFSKGLSHESFRNEFASKIARSNTWDWHPDDYIFCNGQSLQEKDAIDARRMHDYLKEIKFYNKIIQMEKSSFIDKIESE